MFPCKTHCLKLGGKLSEKKKILSFINCFPFLSHITDNPRRQARIKKIDYKDKTNEK